MIEERNGDLLVQRDLCAIVHQANCFHTMGSGIAMALSVKWPQVYQADLATKHGDRAKMGTFSMAMVEHGLMRVYNLYSQFRYGRTATHTEYDMMAKGLRAINEDLDTPHYYEGVFKIGIPYRMGCGSAGGNWDYVMHVLEDIYDSGDDIDGHYKLVICKI